MDRSLRGLSREVSGARRRGRADAETRTAGRMGQEPPRLSGRSEGRRRARCIEPGAERPRAERALVPRRLRGPRAVEQDHAQVRGRGRPGAGHSRRQEPALRHPRARNGRDGERAFAVEAAGVRRDVLHLQRLRAAGDPALRPDGAADDLRLHARCDGRRRGRSDAPADRAARLAPCDPRPHADPAGRRERGGRGLSVRDAASPPAGGAGAVAPAAADAGPEEVRVGVRRRARRLCACRRPRRQARGHPDRYRQRGEPRGAVARAARRRRRPFARGVDAVVGRLRARAAGLPRRACCRRR